MQIVNMPFCCTSAIIGSFGEHGEPSVVSVAEIKRLVKSKMDAVWEDEVGLVDNPKRFVLAISVDPANIAILKEAGFKVVDTYDGMQGKVHVMSFHIHAD